MNIPHQCIALDGQTTTSLIVLGGGCITGGTRLQKKSELDIFRVCMPKDFIREVVLPATNVHLSLT